MGISQRTIQAIKDYSLAAIVEESGGTLKRSGREFNTHCLWHDDNSPSLNIVEDKGFMFCPVCRTKADAIDYIAKKYGLGWVDSVERAADIAGIAIEIDGGDQQEYLANRQERKSFIDRLLKEHAAYRLNLQDDRAERIRQLLIDRGITAEASKEFEIGFAPSGFFAQRITIPILNHRNEIVGFTGRTTIDQPAKYKNSEDSVIFKKKSLVFNEVRAKQYAREAASLIFVEGHLDVVSMWQHNIRNVVALQGTGAPEPDVLKRLARGAKNFVLCFDGDQGGKKASELFIGSAGSMAMAGEISINVVNLPEGKDPDEILRSGQNLYHYIATAPSWLDWIIDTWAADLDKSDTAKVTEVESRLKRLIDGLRSKALRAHYIDRAARVLANNDKEAVSIAQGWGNRAAPLKKIEWSTRTVTETRTMSERRMLRIYVHKPGLRDRLRQLLDYVHNPALRWLSLRISELESYSLVDLTPHSVMAVVSVAEPHYLQQLRTLVRPNVCIDTSEGVLAHIEKILRQDIIASELLFEDHKP